MARTSSAAVVRLNTGYEIELDGGPESMAFIRSEIRASGLLYKALAEQAGVCPLTVSNIACGQTHAPRHATIAAILRVLGWRIYARQGR